MLDFLAVVPAHIDGSESTMLRSVCPSPLNLVSPGRSVKPNPHQKLCVRTVRSLCSTAKFVDASQSGKERTCELCGFRALRRSASGPM